MRRLLALSLAFVAALACAQNPGSRLRTTPEVPQPPASSDSTRDPAKPCADLRGEQRTRCLAQVHNSPTPLGSNGPSATGTGTGATGMGGGAASSSAAPR